jgi:hypothetical protein
MTDSPAQPKLLTFGSIGWVLLLMGLICTALVVWAVGPAVLRGGKRPPGDNKTIESYGFDLSTLAVPRELVVPAMMHRDMVPVMFDPQHSGPDDTVADPVDRWRAMQRANDLKYGKYLVANDKVLGVTINGESRAYPLFVLYVHEVINDTLGGVPIAVTHHWPCDSAVVFDRRVGDAVVTLGVSGLVFNSNALYYDRPATVSEDDPPQQLPSASLWSQLHGRAVSGPLAGTVLAEMPSEVTLWEDWSARHPGTTVLHRNNAMASRYKDATPTPYFKSEKILFPVDPMPSADTLPAKARVLAVTANGQRRVYPIALLAQWAKASDDGRSCTHDLGGVTLHFTVDGLNETATVTASDPNTKLLVTPAFWFAWHAMHPNDEVATP